MSRVGKIARLPEHIREQINRRLQDGEEGKDIIAWLNSLDEVKAVLAGKFGGRPINDGNLSEWKLGGYRDWESQQIALAEARRVTAEGRELADVGNKALADNLAVWLTGRYVLATRKLMENGDDASAWKMLRALCHDVVALRKGDHGVEWLRIEREKLKLRRKKQHSDREKLKQEILKENPPREVLSDEEKERQWNEIFGICPDSYPMHGGRSPFEPTADPADPPPPPEASISPIPPIPPEEDSETRELKRVTELAEKGDAYSAYCLGTRYRDGFSVPKDLAKAREWLGKAASQGLGNAVRELHVLALRSECDFGLTSDGGAVENQHL